MIQSLKSTQKTITTNCIIFNTTLFPVKRIRSIFQNYWINTLLSEIEIYILLFIFNYTLMFTCCVMFFLCPSFFSLPCSLQCSSINYNNHCYCDLKKKQVFFSHLAITLQSVILSLMGLYTANASIIHLNSPFLWQNRNIQGYWVQYNRCGCSEARFNINLSLCQYRNSRYTHTNGNPHSWKDCGHIEMGPWFLALPWHWQRWSYSELLHSQGVCM